MNRFASLIARYKVWVAAALAALLCASCVFFAWDIASGRVDADLVNYLGEGFDSREGLDFLHDTFRVNGDIMIAVEGEEEDAELAKRMGAITAMEGVTELIWYGTLEEAGGYLGDVEWLLTLFGVALTDIYDDSALREYLRREDGDGGYVYLVLMLIEYSPSSSKAFSLLNKVENALEGRAFATAGMTATSRNIMRDTLKEAPIYVLLAVIGMYLLLLLSSESWLEPFVILIPVAAAIILNAGTNFMFSRVSVISLAACAVLQLTVTTDFCLFINRFLKKSEEKETSGALRAAVSGAVVTGGAFAALFTMRFGLGGDLAASAIKAAALSLFSAVVSVPLTRALLHKALAKTRIKKPAHVETAKFSSFVVRARCAALAAALIVTVIAGFMLSYPDCSYFKIYKHAQAEERMTQLAGEMENQLILAVPVAPEEGLSQQDFVRELSELESVDKVIGAFSAVKMDAKPIELALNLIDFSKIPHINTIFRQSGDRWYTLSIVVLKDGAESAQAEADYMQIKEISSRYFEDSYAFGLLTGVHDMRTVSPGDFRRILWITACAALLLSILTLFSVRQGLAVGVLSVAAVVINLALEGVASRDTNFLIYLVIPAVQLGSTVHYGMQIARGYKESMRLCNDRKDAAARALAGALPLAAVSLAVILVCSLSVFFVTNNLIIKDLAMLLLRGNMIGFLLMTFVLPGLLSFGNPFKKVS